MDTVITDDPQVAAAMLRAGQLVAFPTETVYGLGASALDPVAIAAVFAAKGRPADNPLIAHVGDLPQIHLVARSVPPSAAALIARFFPGPLTVVLPKQAAVPLLATGGLDSIGVRMPDHPVALALLRACGVPVVAPSANLSGRPSPTTWQAVAADLSGRIACILRGEPTRLGLESTVVDCTGARAVLLRPGAVTLEQLRTVLPDVQLAADGAVVAPRSPGQKYRHYAPTARVVLSPQPPPAPGPAAAWIGLDLPPVPSAYAIVQICFDVAAYARTLFEFFRDCDRRGIATIHCQEVPDEGLGRALMDRLRRAARG